MTSLVWQVFIGQMYCSGPCDWRRRAKIIEEETEENAKVVAAVWGTYLNAVLAI